MTAYLIIFVAAMAASALTLFSGFGLGTLLMPVYALFFPLEIAVAATAIVHAANNIFKISLVGKHADKKLMIQFGVPAILAAFLGAYLLGYVAQLGQLAHYKIGQHEAVITPIKLLLAVLMVFFALFELLPRLKTLQFDQKYLLVGGLLSGFFGGFSGHQGALRSAFLAKVGISAEAFVGTNAVIAFMVDSIRIVIYVWTFISVGGGMNSAYTQEYPFIMTGMIAAFIGVVIGKRYLHKVTMNMVQNMTGALLLVIAVALGLGWI